MKSSSPRNLKVGIRGSLRELQTILADPSSQYIKTVFVGAPKHLGPTGRFKTYPTNIKILKEITQVTHAKGIETDVVLNTWDPGKNPYAPHKEKKIKRFIASLERINVDWITLASPLWIRWANEVRTKIKINLSLYAFAVGPLFAKEFVEMGVNNITLPQHINRDFPLLRRIKKCCGVPLTVFVNSKCVNGGFCPYLFAHRFYKSHQTLVSANQWTKVQDPFLCHYCNPRRKAKLIDILFAPTIRPEDMWLYEKIGIHQFKIASRQASASRTIKLVRAYGQRKFSGRFGELWTVSPMKDKTPPNRFLDGVLKKVMHWPEEKQFEYFVALADKYEKIRTKKNR